jgi:hypothetical protein
VVQPLDLEEPVSDQKPAPKDTFEPPARSVDEAGEGGEVEGRLFHTAVSQQLEPAGNEELHQAVRGLPVAAH